MQIKSLSVKLSSFILKKQYKHHVLINDDFPATINIPDEIKKPLLDLVPLSSSTLGFSTVPPPIFIQQPSSYVLHTVNTNISINSFPRPNEKFVTEILNCLRQHVELAPTTDPFAILSHIFETYRNLQSLLQFHNNNIQTHFIYNTR